MAARFRILKRIANNRRTPVGNVFTRIGFPGLREFRPAFTDFVRAVRVFQVILP